MSIEVKNLSFIYNEGTAFEKKALDNISFTIEKGEFVGLIGHTGSGKSTLIQHLNGLLKPSSGTVILDGADIHADKTKLRDIRRKVGLVFQYPEHQLFETTVFKDVAYGPGNLNISKDEINKRVCDALNMVGIDEEDYEKSPFELSGGQKRRAAIAGVLAMSPEVLILDEPTAGLDPRGRDEILGKIKDMRDRLEITIILISHSMEDIARLSDRIMVMHDGRLALDGPPSDVFKKAELLESIGLAAPQITYLIRELNRRGFNLSYDIYTEEAAFSAICAELSACLKEVPK